MREYLAVMGNLPSSDLPPGAFLMGLGDDGVESNGGRPLVDEALSPLVNLATRL